MPPFDVSRATRLTRASFLGQVYADFMHSPRALYNICRLDERYFNLTQQQRHATAPGEVQCR